MTLVLSLASVTSCCHVSTPLLWVAVTRGQTAAQPVQASQDLSQSIMTPEIMGFWRLSHYPQYGIKSDYHLPLFIYLSIHSSVPSSS